LRFWLYRSWLGGLHWEVWESRRTAPDGTSIILRGVARPPNSLTSSVISELVFIRLHETVLIPPWKLQALLLCPLSAEDLTERWRFIDLRPAHPSGVVFVHGSELLFEFQLFSLRLVLLVAKKGDASETKCSKPEPPPAR
jgi:hypothetical protein